MTSFKTLDDVSVAGKRVLVRVDLNVPMDGDRVTDTTRIDRVAPTIAEIADHGGKVILLAHFGRPKGQVNPALSLRQVVDATAGVLGRPVGFAGDCIGDHADSVVNAMADGDIVILENTRFHPGEENNNADFAQALARNGDLFVNDAFSAAHRAHASTVGLTAHMPAVAGRAMQSELEALESGLGSPKRPVLAVVGGAKVSSKIDLLENLVTKVDGLIIGGGMANTFLAAQGIDVGKSLCEHDLADTALKIMAVADAAGCDIVLPTDVVVADEFGANAKNAVYDKSAVPADGMILDVGPNSIAAIKAKIDAAATLVWNGPLGAFEIEPFDTATVAAARHAGERTAAGQLISVAGGGDTVAALHHAGADQQFTYISTAGGAFLEWMEGKPLPGVEALKR